MTLPPLTPEQLALLLEVDGEVVPAGEAAELRALGEPLRAVVGGGVDVADDVMLALGLQSAVGGEIDVADDVMLALGLQSAVGGGVEVADDVMLSIGLQSAVGGGVDVVEPVMAAVRPIAVAPAPVAEATMPRWASLGGMGAIFSMAAAALFALQAGTVGVSPPPGLEAGAPEAMLALARVNDAEVEDVSTPENASVSVMQFGEGGPTIIFVQELEG
jgi:hypothetical protein